jgi:predicted transcriptional regulator
MLLLHIQPNISYGIVNTKQYHLYSRINNHYHMESISQLTKKGASCTDLLTCLYNLKSADLQALQAVAKNENATLDQIAKLLQKDRSSIHRCLAKLVSLNIVTKQTRTLKGGGYYHAYAMQDPAVIKKHAKERVKEITSSLDKLVDNFESDFRAHMNRN